MKHTIRLPRVFLLMIFIALPVMAQSSADFETKYGKPLKFYELRPGIIMSAKYATDAQVCEVIIERRHYTGTGVDTISSLPEQMISELIDELAPATVRGKKTKDDGLRRISGMSMDKSYNYENVTARSIGGGSSSQDNNPGVLIIQWKHRECK